MAKTLEDFNAEVIAAQDRYDFTRRGLDIPNDPSWLYSDQLASLVRYRLSGLRTARLCRARFNGTHTKEEWAELKAMYGNRCLRCGSTPVEKDHIVPLVDSDSSDSIDNLQPLCGHCNTSKGTKRINYRAKMAVRDGH